MAAALALVAQQRQPPTPAQQIINNVNGVNRRILEMAKDFPEEKYNFRATPEVRSFGEVILHVMAGNTYGAKVARGVPDANWDKEEVDPKNYHGKAEIVAAFEKSANDAADAVRLDGRLGIFRYRVDVREYAKKLFVNLHARELFLTRRRESKGERQPDCSEQHREPS